MASTIRFAARQGLTEENHKHRRDAPAKDHLAERDKAGRVGRNMRHTVVVYSPEKTRDDNAECSKREPKGAFTIPAKNDAAAKIRIRARPIVLSAGSRNTQNASKTVATIFEI